mmetsp:Transcript_37035/g.82332  ORF Transcript_37035/g.82332 Transcript_37035/m.82332 type:complete len:328 (+) Transcript_37035:137-1120(+)
MATPSIPKRTLGKTGLQVSVLGYGASPLGGVFEPIDEGKGIQAVHDAFKAGVNFFDTSPFYGATKSETVLGQALKDLPRSEIIISTKVGRYGQDLFDFSAARVTASVAESLTRLQTDYIDIIQCHDIEYGSLDQIISETLPALVKLREEGKVRHIGITGLPLAIYKYVLDRVPPGTVDVVLSYCHNSLNDTTLQGLLPYLEDKGVGVITASPLSMGLLTKQGPPIWHPAPPQVQEACRDAAQCAAAAGVDIAKLALAQSVRTPGIATTLVGMATPDIVAANVEATLEALGLLTNADDRKETAALAEVERVLKPIKDVTWPSGKPENN